MSLRHSSKATPRVYPWKVCRAHAQIDRVQEITGSDSLNREKIKEVGRVGTVEWREGTPEVSATIRQYEFGEIDFFSHLSNNTLATTSIDLNDFKTSKVGLGIFCTDDDDTFKSTIWLEEMKVSGFSISIGDPEALIERSISLVGQKHKELQGNNKYLIALREVTSSGEAGDQDVVIGAGDYWYYPDPVEDPNNSGDYMLKVVHYDSSAGTTTEAAAGTTAGTYRYVNATKTLTFFSTATDDVWIAYYSAASYIQNSDAWTDNDVDAGALEADSVTVLLKTTSDTVYRLQNCNIDVSFDRFDIREIGNQDVVAEGVRAKTVTITLDRVIDTIRIEEIMQGQAADYGIIDIREFLDNVTVAVKIYSDATKTTFKMGYEFTNLAATSLDTGLPVDEYTTKSITLEGEEGIITNLEGDLTITA